MSSNVTTKNTPWNSTISDSTENFEFTFQNCVFIFLASMMSLTTVLANVMLIILVCVDAKLRRYSNYYIISLACADLVVGIFVIPMFSLYTILGRWPLGPVVCEIWIIFDFSCVSASIFSISIISLDRYWAISQPLKHLKRQRRKRALLIVCAIWVVAMLCWTPAVIVIGVVSGSYAIESACLYLPGFIYVLLSNTIVFLCPMLLMVCLYAKMMYALKKHLRNLTEVTRMGLPDTAYARIFCCCKETFKPDSTLAENKQLSISTVSILVDSTSSFTLKNVIDTDLKTTYSSRTSTDTLGLDELHSVSRLSSDSLHVTPTQSLPSPLQQETRVTGKSLSGANESYSKRLTAKRAHRHNLVKHRLHQRTARTLGVIVVSFILCWIFFVILFPVNSYCNCVPLWLYDMAYWLAYMNSTLNPFLYGFNKDFRKALRRLICPSKKYENNSVSNF
nr:beta-1 adrenergic receptor-like [Lytechinus pictus]